MAYRQDLLRKASLSQRLRPTFSCSVRSRVLWTVTRHACQARSTSGERCEPPRHGCITTGADTIADLKRHRGLCLVPADRLLAPGTDDLERGNDSTCVHVPRGCRRRVSLVFHRCSPSPIVKDSKTPQRSRPCSTGQQHPAAHPEQGYGDIIEGFSRKSIGYMYATV